MNILETILKDKRVEVEARRKERSLTSLHGEAAVLAPPPGFASALRSAPIGLIAEVKHRSPSAGVIRDPFDPAAIARAYAAAGAQAVSVLMDGPWFGGGEAHFRAVREAVEAPMLYKEFVIDPWQVWHARVIGASAVLLIAAALDDDTWTRLVREATAAGLEVLVEVHDGEELDRALSRGTPMIGINNRDLKTFETRLEHTLDLAPKVPEEVTLVSESGIRAHADVERLRAAGCSGVLVGEHLLRTPDVEAATRRLMGAP